MPALIQKESAFLVIAGPQMGQAQGVNALTIQPDHSVGPITVLTALGGRPCRDCTDKMTESEGLWPHRHEGWKQRPLNQRE